MKDFLLITYSIKNLEKSKRVRFVYLLKGRRDDKGIISELKGRFMAPGCFIIPKRYEKDIKDIFRQWRVKHQMIDIKK